MHCSAPHTHGLCTAIWAQRALVRKHTRPSLSDPGSQCAWCRAATADRAAASLRMSTVKATKPDEEVQEPAEAAIPDSHVPVSLKQADEVCVLDVAPRFTLLSCDSTQEGSCVSRLICRRIDIMCDSCCTSGDALSVERTTAPRFALCARIPCSIFLAMRTVRCPVLITWTWKS